MRKRRMIEFSGITVATGEWVWGSLVQAPNGKDYIVNYVQGERIYHEVDSDSVRISTDGALYVLRFYAQWEKFFKNKRF